MKINIKKYTLAIITVAGLMLTACEDQLPLDFIGTESKVCDRYLLTEATLCNTYQIIDIALRDSLFRSQDSAVVDGAIVTKAGNIIRIDFENGAIGQDGRFRKGFIEVNELSDYRGSGGSAHADLQDYFLDEFNIAGILDLYNYGSDSLLMTISNFKATDSLEVNASKSIYWTSGFNTSNIADDKYNIRGQAHGEYGSGSMDVLSSTPLVIDRSCSYRALSGILDLSLHGDSLESTGTIDFINDGCENLAKIHLQKGERELLLSRQFFGF